MTQQHPNTPTSAQYVEPRIQKIERRIQQRTTTPEAKDRTAPAPTAANAAPLQNDGNNDNLLFTPTPKKNRNTTTASNSNNNSNNKNSALILHSPILSSLLPNSNIKQFESDLLKKQAQYASRISDLEGRLALFHSRLANECAERGREHAFTAEEYIHGPLERVMTRSLERIQEELVFPVMDPKRANAASANAQAAAAAAAATGDDATNEARGDTNNDPTKEEEETDSNHNPPNNPLPNLVSIERRTHLLEAQMNHHQHVTLFHSRQTNFDAIDRTCRTSLQPSLSLEITKANKRELELLRRFESSSGEYTRQSSEMTSSRTSSLGYVEKTINDWDMSDMMRAEHYLEEIQKLKRAVLEEREERIRRDEMVVQEIVRTKKRLEEDILLAC